MTKKENCKKHKPVNDNSQHLQNLKAQYDRARAEFRDLQKVADKVRNRRDEIYQQISYQKYKDWVGRCFKSTNTDSYNSWDIYYKILTLSSDSSHFQLMSIQMIPDSLAEKPVPSYPEVKIRTWPCDMIGDWRRIDPVVFERAFEQIIRKIRGKPEKVFLILENEEFYDQELADGAHDSGDYEAENTTRVVKIVKTLDSAEKTVNQLTAKVKDKNTDESTYTYSAEERTVEK